MTEKEDIKPCPFCGEDENVTSENYEDNYWMMCRGCYAEGPVRKSVDAALSAWNGRSKWI